MLLLSTIIAALLIIFTIGKISLTIQFDKKVKQLFALAKPVFGKQFSYTQLEGLPVPVQRYFKYVLKDGQSYISYARLLHKGQFKTGLRNDWVSINGEQYFTSQKPGFIWKGTTRLFTAQDMFLADKGRLIVSLLAVYKVVNGRGTNFDQGELLRWLAENVWFPTNLLPNNQLNWLAIDENTAKLTFNYIGMALFYIVTFNNIGEIIQMETKRYMENKLETWIGKLYNYQEMNGIRIPTNIEAIWRLEKGDFNYARFEVTRIDYDQPFAF